MKFADLKAKAPKRTSYQGSEGEQLWKNEGNSRVNVEGFGDVDFSNAGNIWGEGNYTPTWQDPKTGKAYVLEEGPNGEVRPRGYTPSPTSWGGMMGDMVKETAPYIAGVLGAGMGANALWGAPGANAGLAGTATEALGADGGMFGLPTAQSAGGVSAGTVGASPLTMSGAGLGAGQAGGAGVGADQSFWEMGSPTTAAGEAIPGATGMSGGSAWGNMGTPSAGGAASPGFYGDQFGIPNYTNTSTPGGQGAPGAPPAAPGTPPGAPGGMPKLPGGIPGLGGLGDALGGITDLLKNPYINAAGQAAALSGASAYDNGPKGAMTNAGFQSGGVGQLDPTLMNKYGEATGDPNAAVAAAQRANNPYGNAQQTLQDTGFRPGGVGQMPTQQYNQYTNFLANPGDVMGSNPAYKAIMDASLQAAQRAGLARGQQGGGTLQAELAKTGAGVAGQFMGQLGNMYQGGAQQEAGNWSQQQQANLGMGQLGSQVYGQQAQSALGMGNQAGTMYNAGIQNLGDAARTGGQLWDTRNRGNLAAGQLGVNAWQSEAADQYNRGIGYANMLTNANQQAGMGAAASPYLGANNGGYVGAPNVNVGGYASPNAPGYVGGANERIVQPTMSNPQPVYPQEANGWTSGYDLPQPAYQGVDPSNDPWALYNTPT